MAFSNYAQWASPLLREMNAATEKRWRNEASLIDELLVRASNSTKEYVLKYLISFNGSTRLAHWRQMSPQTRKPKIAETFDKEQKI
jgi:hypothetical protein